VLVAVVLGSAGGTVTCRETCPWLAGFACPLVREVVFEVWAGSAARAPHPAADRSRLIPWDRDVKYELVRAESADPVRTSVHCGHST